MVATDRGGHTVEFLFGRRPDESALLQAGALAAHLVAAGWHVRLRALGRSAHEALARRFGGFAPELAPAPGLLDTLLHRFPSRDGATGPAHLLHAWSVDAADRAAGACAPDRPLCVTLSDPRDVARLLASQAWRQAAGRGCAVLCQSTAGPFDPSDPLPAGNTPLAMPILVEPDAARAGRERREQARAALGPLPEDAPVFAVLPPVEPSTDPLAAMWATGLVRKSGTAIRLVLPEPSREAARVARFAKVNLVAEALAIAPPATPWSDVVAAADAIVVPTRTPVDPVPLAWAMAAGLPVVAAAGSADEAMLIDGQTCVRVADPQPIVLARHMLRLHEDAALATAVSTGAAAWASRVLDPQAAGQAYARLYASLLARHPIAAPHAA